MNVFLFTCNFPQERLHVPDKVILSGWLCLADKVEVLIHQHLVSF